jgi:hypothetical protein
MVDGARFLPCNVTISRVVVTVQGSTHEALNQKVVQVGLANGSCY